MGKRIALHALARNVGAVTAGLAPGHLVQLVDEDDAILLGPMNRLLGHPIHVDELADFLVGERIQGLGHAETAVLGALVLRKHVLQVEHHLFHAGARKDIDEGLSPVAGVDLDHLVVELTVAQQAAQVLARGGLDGRHRLGRGDGARQGYGARRGSRRARGRQENVEKPLLGVFARARLGAFTLFLAQHGHGGLGQIAHHGIHVAPHVANLGELGGLDLDEGRVGQLGQAPRDLGLAHAGGADEHDVLGRDLVAHGARYLLPAPAIAQGHRHGALGRALAHDVAIQLLDDGARGERQRALGVP